MLSSPSGLAELVERRQFRRGEGRPAASLPSPVVPSVVAAAVLPPQADSASIAAAETATRRRVPSSGSSLVGRAPRTVLVPAWSPWPAVLPFPAVVLSYVVAPPAPGDVLAGEPHADPVTAVGTASPSAGVLHQDGARRRRRGGRRSGSPTPT